MRHRKRSTRLGVKAPHRLAMLRNLTLGLVEHGRIRTTVARAKVLRPFVEKLVTRLKDPSLANIRAARSVMPQREAVLTIAEKISPVFKDRNGGYTRILKLATPRPGDNADLALIEWVEESLVPAYSQVEAKPATKSAKSGKKGAKSKGASKAKKGKTSDSKKSA